MLNNVSIKALNWFGDDAHTGIVTMYHLEESGADSCVILEKIQGASIMKSFHLTRENAKAAAQADFDRLITSALVPSSPGKDGGQEVEAVAWRFKFREDDPWYTSVSKRDDADSIYACEPLYAAPSPQSTVDADAVIERCAQAVHARYYGVAFLQEFETANTFSAKDIADTIRSLKAKSPSSDRAASEVVSPQKIPRIKWASEMTDEEISTELFQLGQVVSEGFGEGSGSPGEWYYERHDELSAEQDRRAAEAKVSGQ